MYKEKKISPQAVFALKEALSVVFWKKEDLLDFIKISLENHPIIATIDWGKTKREAVKELIERMINRTDIYQDQLMMLVWAASDFDDFSNLKYWDEDGSKTQRARLAIQNLRLHTKGYFQLTKEKEESMRRKRDADIGLLKKKSLNEEIEKLKSNFFSIASNKNLQERGYQLEKFLYELLMLHELEPKGSFKNQGEQIDGAFTFQGTDYLLEAKWKQQVDRGDLADFCFKVETKFKTAVGLLVTIEGVTRDAISPHFKSIIIMDGIDIISVLEGRVSLNDLLFRKRRAAIEKGDIYLNYTQL